MISFTAVQLCIQHYRVTMFISLRTTIFWNLCLLMVLSAAMISFVVYRVMEKELQRQGVLAGRAVYNALAAGIPELPEKEAPALQALFKRHVDSGSCTEIILTDSKNRVIAEAPGPGSRLVYDDDVARVLETGEFSTRLEKRFPTAAPRIVATGRLRFSAAAAGVLKAVIPLREMYRSMRHAYNIIFIYIVSSAAILIIVGFILFSRYLVAPMQRLIRVTESIAQENLSGMPLFLSGGNELGKLGSALKSLADNLKIERLRLVRQMQVLEEKNVQLQLARRESLQSEKLASVGRLAAGIAHEVGNPLGIILGYIHLLRSADTTDAQRADYLQRLEHETERIKNTIGDLLNFAQPSTQDVAKLQLNEIVEDVCSMVSCHKEFKNIEIVQHLDPGLPEIRGNDRLVRQMLLNLALNACDAMQDGGGRLSIKTALDSGPNAGKIRLTIADTGHGIAPELREKIFDPFFTTRDHGTGLGLANVHRIVELMEGGISFESTPGQGTTFTILLPAGIS